MTVLHLISSHALPEFNLSLIGSFTWLTPPGPYTVTTCRRRELNFRSHTYFVDHTRTLRASPDEWSAQCRSHLRDCTNMKDDTHQPHTRSFQEGEYEIMIWRANDIRGPWGPKVSWHLSYRWGKTPKKTSSRIPVLTVERNWPAAWQARMLPPVPKRWTVSKKLIFIYF